MNTDQHQRGFQRKDLKIRAARNTERPCVDLSSHRTALWRSPDLFSLQPSQVLCPAVAQSLCRSMLLHTEAISRLLYLHGLPRDTQASTHITFGWKSRQLLHRQQRAQLHRRGRVSKFGFRCLALGRVFMAIQSHCMSFVTESSPGECTLYLF